MWIELNNLDKNFDIVKNYTKNFKINFAFNSNDEILTKKMHGIPEDAIILDVGVGSGFVERYKKKHKLK